MREAETLDVRPVNPEEYARAAEFWLAMRHELRMPDADLAHDWQERAVQYFQRRYHAGELMWFFAWENEAALGSSCGFVMDGYPSEICTQRRLGYVAGIFVRPQWRRRGIARALTQAAIAWLSGIGCAPIRLHAADAARPIYESLGFIATNEMQLRAE